MFLANKFGGGLWLRKEREELDARVAESCLIEIRYFMDPIHIGKKSTTMKR